ncbi:MAG: hypothetical protein F4123_10395 [Gemmatimonadetes bacterium]|nr:hypothetical protein [Gemmatimonadota bacterium]MYI46767.1 hypothetical protein [Gemmatimonadota bacterium]
MRTIRLKRSGNGRLTAAGLFLSLGLILGAGEVIESRTAAQEPTAPKPEEVVEPVDHRSLEQSPGATRSVHHKGHPRFGRTFQL